MNKGSIECSYREIFDVLSQNLHLELDIKIKTLEEHLSKKRNKTFTFYLDEKDKLKRLLNTITRKWHESNRTRERFLSKNEEWLKKIMEFQIQYLSDSNPMKQNKEEVFERSRKRGRPSKEFEDASERTKVRLQVIYANHTVLQN